MRGRRFIALGLLGCSAGEEVAVPTPDAGRPAIDAAIDRAAAPRDVPALDAIDPPGDTPGLDVTADLTREQFCTEIGRAHV